MSVSLHDIAPRLARARDQLVAQRQRERRARMQARDALLKAERLIAHRELQLIRAQHLGKRNYIAARQRKLDAALRELRQAQRRLAEAERGEDD